MSPGLRTQIFHGPVVNPQTLWSYQTLPRCLLCVAPSGDIAWVIDNVPDSMVQEVLAQKGLVGEGANVDFVSLKKGDFLVPGFVDTHTVRLSSSLRLLRLLLRVDIVSVEFCGVAGMLYIACATDAEYREVSIYPSSYPYDAPIQVLTSCIFCRGSGQQYELLDWLDNVTFPMEARFADVKFAEKAYETTVKRIISSGVGFVLPLIPCLSVVRC